MTAVCNGHATPAARIAGENLERRASTPMLNLKIKGKNLFCDSVYTYEATLRIGWGVACIDLVRLQLKLRARGFFRQQMVEARI